MKRNDFILIGTVLFIAAAIIIFMAVTKVNGDKVVVKVDGKIYKELPLNEDITLTIRGYNGGTNVLAIKNGYADITEASCPDKICVKQKHIKYNGETIVCLPNKVIVQIESDKENELDAVAN